MQGSISETAFQILITDDHEQNRYYLRRILEREGFRVIEASTGEEALRLAVSQMPDLLLLDVKLPDLSGHEVCHRLRSVRQTSSILVLQMSANFTRPTDQAQGLEGGADGYLVSPIDPDLLLATVRSLLRTKEEHNVRERFVSTLSHDLRTPLTAAKLNAQILARLGKTDDKMVRSARKVIENIDRTDRMISDLLDANRIRFGERLPLFIESCNIREVLDATVEELTLIHGNRFEVQCATPIVGFWDANGIRRILENLGNNAIKYGSPTDPVKISVAQDDSRIEIAVHNLGTPIPEDEQSHLFDPFHRARAAKAGGQKGWGLGLTLVRGVTEAHGGSVTVESSAEKGTTFSVCLPNDSRSQQEQLFG